MYSDSSLSASGQRRALMSATRSGSTSTAHTSWCWASSTPLESPTYPMPATAIFIIQAPRFKRHFAYYSTFPARRVGAADGLFTQNLRRGDLTLCTTKCIIETKILLWGLCPFCTQSPVGARNTNRTGGHCHERIWSH